MELETSTTLASSALGWLLDGLGVVLGWWGGGGPLLGGLVGCPWWGSWVLICYYSLHGGVARPRVWPPLKVGAFLGSRVSFHVGRLPIIY